MATLPNIGLPDEEFAKLKSKLWHFMETEIYPNEKLFEEQSREIERQGNEWYEPEILKELKMKAKEANLWNLWLPSDLGGVIDMGPQYAGAGLNNKQYGALCEIMGTANHMEFAAQATNCTSPDTGNMETIGRFGTKEQKEKWLKPLLDGRIKSCFAMTEPAVASSDASNISIDIQKDYERGEYVINGRKWWITGAGSLKCQIMILMGKTDPDGDKHLQQSMVLVPMDTPGITLLRPMQVMGDADAPKGHMDILYENVRVPFENVLLGEGRGFEIAQARLGPGRIHHCMRLIGAAERALSLMCRRVTERKAFGKYLVDFDSILQDIAKSRNEIDMGRMLVTKAADIMDTSGSKVARKELSMCKAVVPQMVQTVADRCIQAHGAMGLCQDTPLATTFLWARFLRFADGPDEVHWRTVARMEVKEQQQSSPLHKIGHYQPDLDNVFRRTTDDISDFAKSKL
eukprot:CAMPEP_0114419716 /NCGR_PEP_ID=MMETSP0103-20121206/4179_1 /TAXON_ID=37642 ORGANISM="Paraphysomonas imperforata, Strain PA2" /NCGR_SAMPLE_ID=MMETSP0103 /ASSEMBLY_ACC=CAM_ASM_000201 /LENGTH=458 /DNA_ID=CAMNT_0001588161 /DNA_START=54 /DNA_END=1430 /DNA_ORIENTATION=+